MIIRTYSKTHKDDNSVESVYNLIPISPPQYNELKERCTIIKRNLQVSSEVRKDIEQATRLQAECLLWHQVRQQRITGSKCGQILGQKARSSALLMSVLYSKPLFPLPAAIKWGLDNEEKARQAYAVYIRRGGHPTIEVINCGFFIPQEEEWFGASPDGIVLDKSDVRIL